jgi:hypothetical protein
LDPDQRQQILSLAGDFPRLWRDPSTPHRERKRMVPLLIEDVTLRKAEQIEVSVRFRGGVNKVLSLARPINYFESRKHSSAGIAEIDQLLDHYNHGEIANILNSKGYRTGPGVNFDGAAVCRIRRSYSLKSRYQRLRDRGLLTLSEIAEKLRVSDNTIRRWQERGLIQAYVYDDHNNRLYEDPGPIGPKNGRRRRRLVEHTMHEEVQCEA